VQDFDMQIQEVFKDCSRTTVKIVKELYINIHGTYITFVFVFIYTRSPKYQK